MASTSISTSLFLIWVVIFLACQEFSLSLALQRASLLNVPASAISAAPALLPNPPISSPSSSPPFPSLSPDISPLFPSPGGSELAPTDSSLPLIPSSPSPPNPDAMIAPGPMFMPFSPTESLPVSSAVPLLSSLCTMLVFGLISFGFTQLYNV
ncbi:classical arabinogalactan protein 26-like [Lycium ferocissimum]|uniref:classical arabinogalactan protein 26-like n=1 Tax=Lycium ferocissimum TaxID=112874 RepID=UPI0028169EE0|nr:classical arabinogalactan protein 26-like [Lycium ferocissimum]